MFFNTEDTLIVHNEILGDKAVRDMFLIESALGRAFHSYDDAWEQAAALLQSLSRNHPFIDGNKRTAWITCREYLKITGYPLRKLDTDTVEEFVIATASGKLEFNDVIQGLKNILGAT